VAILHPVRKYGRTDCPITRAKLAHLLLVRYPGDCPRSWSRWSRTYFVTGPTSFPVLFTRQPSSTFRTHVVRYKKKSVFQIYMDISFLGELSDWNEKMVLHSTAGFHHSPLRASRMIPLMRTLLIRIIRNIISNPKVWSYTLKTRGNYWLFFSKLKIDKKATKV
jgi:hypothetical protein